MIEAALSDAERLRATVDRLARAGLAGFAVTGGVAIGRHLSQGRGPTPAPRPLHDLDLVVEGLDAVPPGLGGSFAIRHVHPDAPPGRMLVQAVDRANALRVDVFGARGRTLERARPAALGGASVLVASRGDVLAALTRLVLDLGLGETVPPKHARDFAALAECGADPAEAEAAWADHRRERQPAPFAQARTEAAALIAARPDLLAVGPSPFAVSPCARCRDHPTLKIDPLGGAGGAGTGLAGPGAPR